MRRRLSHTRTHVLVAFFAVAALILSASPAVAWSGWHKDPDSLVDVAKLNAIVTSLLAPDTTIGDTDMTVAGVGSEPVGIDDSLTAPPADPADADPGHTYFVDNTPLNGDCPATPYITIQSAIDDSGPGDTVKVCPGTYPEQVRISGHDHDKLKLESLKPLQAIIQWPPSETPPLALVSFNEADRVTLRGFVITGPFTFTGCSPERHEGILVEQAFDEHIHHNHITLIRNANPAFYGCQEGDGVAIGHRVSIVTTCDGTVPGSARLDHNLIDNYQKNGVAVFNPDSFARVEHNVINGSTESAVRNIIASNGVVVLCEAGAKIDHNVISRHHYTGTAPASSGGVIIAETPSGSSQVEKNRIFDNDYGIETDTQEDLEISHNDVFNHTTDGIVLCGDAAEGCGPATGIVVHKNKVRDNDGSGILLIGADYNLLKSNDVDDNGTAAADLTDGIRIDASSDHNQILKNHMEDNTTHDCHDGSTGTGTAGTANTWQGNRGDTENTSGLCDPK